VGLEKDFIVAASGSKSLLGWECYHHGDHDHLAPFILKDLPMMLMITWKI
jgi:hypothetical protein